MLRLRDSLTLARTKFRTRRVRLVLSLITISFLVAALVSSFVAMQISVGSLEEFSSQGLNGRYLVHVASSINGNIQNELPIETFTPRAMELYEEGIAKEKAVYEKYGLASPERNPNDYPTLTFPSSDEEYLNYSSPYMQKTLKEYSLEHYPPASPEQIKQVLVEYNAISTFELTYSTPSISASGFIPLKDGREPDINLMYDQDNRDKDYELLTSYINQSVFMADELAEPFLLKNYKLEKDQVPVILNYKVAESLLGLEKMPNEATEQEKYDHIQLMREKATAIEFQACWRNRGSLELLSAAMIANGDEKTNLKYSLDGELCQSPIVSEDKRTVEEKRRADIQESIQKDLGKYSEPKSKLITFKVVGLTPEQRGYGYLTEIDDLIESLSVSTIDKDIMNIPQGLFAQNLSQEIKDLFIYDDELDDRLWFMPDTGEASFVVEFNSADDMRKFISEVGCEEGYCEGRLSLIIQPFSNNAAVISDAKNILEKILFWSFLVVTVIIALLIYTVVNRIMADSRKETAVFRAIGYSRLEIAQIYITYVAVYAIISAIVVVIINVILVVVVKLNYEPVASLFFTNFFALEQPAHFTIINFTPLVGLVAIPIFVIGLLASLIPLLINTRRSPLKNLRSE